MCLRVSLYGRPAEQWAVLYSRLSAHDQGVPHGRASYLFTSCASGKNKGSSCWLILSPSPWTATQRLVTCYGLRSITTPTDVLDVKKVPSRGIPDGGLGDGTFCWTRAVPAPNQVVNRTEWCCVRRECASSRCEQVKSHVCC